VDLFELGIKLCSYTHNKTSKPKPSHLTLQKWEKFLRSLLLLLLSDSERERQELMVKPTRKRFATVLMVILVASVGLVWLEVYAHTYIHVDTLPVVTSEYALNSAPIPYNQTRTFSSSGAKWLLILGFPFGQQNDHTNTGDIEVYVFKIQENKSFLIQNVDLVGSNFDVKSTPLGIVPDNIFVFGLYGRNYTMAEGQYLITSTGTFNVNFGFTFRVYEKTSVGILPVDETTVHFNVTMSIPI
jgi:hypothetical protein